MVPLTKHRPQQPQSTAGGQTRKVSKVMCSTPAFMDQLGKTGHVYYTEYTVWYTYMYRWGMYNILNILFGIPTCIGGACIIY